MKGKKLIKLLEKVNIDLTIDDILEWKRAKNLESTKKVVGKTEIKAIKNSKIEKIASEILKTYVKYPDSNNIKLAVHKNVGGDYEDFYLSYQESTGLPVLSDTKHFNLTLSKGQANLRYKIDDDKNDGSSYVFKTKLYSRYQDRLQDIFNKQENDKINEDFKKILQETGLDRNYNLDKL